MGLFIFPPKKSMLAQFPSIHSFFRIVSCFFGVEMGVIWLENPCNLPVFAVAQGKEPTLPQEALKPRFETIVVKVAALVLKNLVEKWEDVGEHLYTFCLFLVYK